ncbi:hypothetical protein [Streptomyces sp. NPDC056982]|uniref:DUF7352 domain-containing protein n=1 Tax=Streptomyces sp. NPDC056982 TaxID=3345986 RepID=UPI003642715E
MALPAVIHRTTLPLDDRPHGIDLTGEILHTAVRRPDAVDVWYQARPDGMEPMRRSFQVVGTGQPIPAHLGFFVTHKGSAVSPDGELVWHVLESHCSHQNVVYTAQQTVGQCEDCGVHLTGDGEGDWIPV